MGNTREAPSDGGRGRVRWRWRGGWRAILALLLEHFVDHPKQCRIVAFQPRGA